MKYLVATLVALALTALSASANCGVKNTDSGTLTSYDSDTGSIIVTLNDGKTAAFTLTADTQATDASGKATKVQALVGKPVKVVSEHRKVDSVAEQKKS